MTSAASRPGRKHFPVKAQPGAASGTGPCPGVRAAWAPQTTVSARTRACSRPATAKDTRPCRRPVSSGATTSAWASAPVTQCRPGTSSRCGPPHGAMHSWGWSGGGRRPAPRPLAISRLSSCGLRPDTTPSAASPRPARRSAAVASRASSSRSSDSSSASAASTTWSAAASSAGSSRGAQATNVPPTRSASASPSGAAAEPGGVSTSTPPVGRAGVAGSAWAAASAKPSPNPPSTGMRPGSRSAAR